MKNKRILLVSNLYPSKNDKTFGTFVRNFHYSLEKYFASDKIELCAIKGRSYGTINKIIKYIAFYSLLFYKVLFFKYDLIYVHYITYSSIPLVFLSKIKKLNIAFNIHGDDLLSKSKVAKSVLNYIYPLLLKSRLIVVPSEYFKDELHIIFPQIEAEKVYISPSGGINSDFFVEHKSNEYLTLGYVSRVDKGKGWNIFLQAIAILKNNDTKVKAIIAGQGTQVAEMYNLVSTLDIKDCVTYLGPVSQNKLPELYSSLNLFIFPTMLNESLGLVGLEAMAASTPVIGSRIGGLKGYIKENVNGYLFNPGDAKDLYLKILKYINLTADSKQELAKNSLETAEKFHEKTTSENLMHKIEKIYLFNNE